MIFSRRQNSERYFSAPLIISGKKIEHVREAQFLAVIVNDNVGKAYKYSAFQNGSVHRNDV